jgi:hypothetical protein
MPRRGALLASDPEHGGGRHTRRDTRADPDPNPTPHVK